MKLLFKPLLVIMCILALASDIIAQKKIFYDAKWEKTKEKNALYYRTITPDGNEFEIKDYYMDGNQIQMEGHYTSEKALDPEKTGVFIYYFKGGQKSREGEYKKGKNEGIWNEWHKDGAKKSSGNYIKGEKEGIWEYYHKKGKLSAKGSYLKGEKDGIWEYFYDTGEKSTIFSYSKGKKDGDKTVYHKNGKLKEKCKFEKDSLNGAYEEYWENGNPSTKGEYVDNKKNGAFEWFHENGKTSCKAEWKNGKFLSGNFYNEEGIKQSEKVYKEDLIEKLEYTGGSEAMYKLIGKQLGNKVDLQGAKKAKYKFYCYITLQVDEKGNVTEREWLIPDLDSETFEDTWEVAENINSAIDDFPRFKPAIAYNRKIKSSYSFICNYDFSK